MLDNNVNQNQLNMMQFQSLTPQQQELLKRQIAMQSSINPELLKENIQDTYVANRVAETTDDPKAMLATAGIAVPAWFTISQGMDVYAKKSRGNFEDTIHHKIGQFGDDAVSRFQNSSIGKSSAVASVNKGFGKFKAFLKKNFIDRFRITRAMAYTPSKPELDMVKGNWNGGVGFVAFDCKQHDEQFVKPLQHIDDLGCYAGTKDDIRKYKDLISKATTAKEKAELMQLAEFECLSKYSRQGAKSGTALDAAMDAFRKLDDKARANTLKDMKAFEWGYKDFAEMEKIGKNMQDHLPRVFEAATNANKKMYAMMTGTAATAVGRAKHFLFGRKVYASETANKMGAFLGNKDLTLPENKEWADALKRTGYDKKLPKSMFGKWLAKYSNLVMEGVTNRVAGGKLVAIAQAAYLADVIYKSAKAEGGGGEKFKTFMERFTEMVAFFVCMPMAVQMMHKIGGLQYAGMDKKAVEAYRKKLAAFNEKAMSGGFADKAEYKQARKALKAELNAGVKNPITKLFKRVGRIVSVGLEQIRPYDKKDIADIAADGTKTYRKGIWSKIKDMFRHPKFGMKQMAGYPMRIALGMFILLPFFNKLAVKGSHLLFGKPKKSLLDEGKEPEKAQAALDPNAVQLPPQLQTQVPLQQTETPVQQGSTNLLEKYKRENPSKIRTNGDTNTYIPSTEPFRPAGQSSNEPVRNYIPSPLGVQVVNNEDLSAADAAMRRAQAAEQLALQTLKMG